MINLIHAINQIVPLKEADVQQLRSLVSERNYSKNQVVREQNVIEKHIYFVQSGLLCGMYEQQDREVVNWFCAENHFITSIKSFHSQAPCLDRIVALEDTRVYKLNYSDINRNFTNHPVLERLIRILMQQSYIVLEERTMSLQCSLARDRYEKFVSSNRPLMQRISLGHLASYLGISQETLSRVRRSKRPCLLSA